MPEHFSSATSSPDVGTTLGRRYRVLRPIGEGGMGVVVEAENLVTGKRVAIKWMHPEVAARPHAIDRFLREARATARVRHPNVVDVYDVVHDADTCFLVMELLEGESLGLALARGGIPAHVVIGYLLDAMRGVLAAHRQGVIHRDIKPDNILLTVQADRAHHVPKVLDFGISKMPDANGLSLTRTGTLMGTPMYMSYEQLCGVKDIDVRTDVYAFGVVLYEALTGVLPYPAANLPQLVAKLAHTVPAPPKQLRPEIPQALDALIQHAIAKEREKRIGSLETLIAELEPFASAAAFQVRPVHQGHQLSKARQVRQVSKAPASAVVLRLQPSAAGAAPRSPNVPARVRTDVRTPMEANVPIPAVPRRRDALRWLVAACAIATLIGVLTAYRSMYPPEAGSGEAAETAAVAAAASGEPKPEPTPSAPAPSPSEDAARESKTDPRTVNHAARAIPEPAPPAARPSSKPVTQGPDMATALPPGIGGPDETRVTERPITLPGGRAAPAAPVSALTARAAPQPSAASPSPPAGTRDVPASASTAAALERPEAQQPPAAPTTRDERRFRAGRPRTEDF